MIIYFSGTGNSRYAAEMLAKELQDEVLDAGKFIKAGIAGEFLSEKPWVFAAPVYSWQMPRIFADFIRKSTFSGNKDAYFVLTCGGEIGEAGKYASDLCREKGIGYQGALQVVMPENLITLFSAPGEEEAKSIVEKAKPVLKNGAELIRAGKAFPEPKITFLDKLKSGPVNKGFNRYFLKSTGYYVTNQCISCGQCADRCVLNNIRMENGRPQWGDTCTQCMSCICLCPAEAIEYGKKTQGKVRYKCPEV